jgi:hypothetical protein
MPNTFIPYPNVPAYPGVPQIVRRASAVIAASPVLAIGIGTAETLLASAYQQAPQWGIFDAAGNQVGLGITQNANSVQSFAKSLEGQFTGKSAPILSTISVDYIKEMIVSDFPVEGGGFASYNKVEKPAEPSVTLALAGSANDRTTFLNAIDAACKSTNNYAIFTPEIQYFDYTFLSYRYSRRSNRGVTLLVVEIRLREIRQVSASYTTRSPIVNPANAASTPQVNNGMAQAVTPEQSMLLSITNKLTALMGAAKGSN